MIIVSYIILIFLFLLFTYVIINLKGFEFTVYLYLSFLYFAFIPSFFIALFSYLFIFISVKVFAFIKYKRNYQFSTYFGIPGSGKTTVAACFTKRVLKHEGNVYSNVPIKGAYEIDKSDIGVNCIEDGLMLLDECGTEFDNRSYKTNFTPQQVKWFKKHRHYKMNIICFSQYWNDIDIKLRNLSTNLYLLKPSLIPFFVCRRKIKKCIGINKDTKDIIDEYSFVRFSSYYFFAPSVWKMFNTHDKEDLPIKQFEVYE